MADSADGLAERIREELGRRRVTRQWLADEAKVSLSTLEKGLAGHRPFTTATLVRIEAALNVALRPRARAENDRPADVAPDDLGAYSHASVRWLEGDYLTVRPSFSTPGAVCAFRTAIAWDEEEAHLIFREFDRADAAYTQRGDVAFPHLSGHVYLLTSESGQFRLAILGRPGIDGTLCGVLTTLMAAGGGRLLPVSCPIALLPLTAPSAPSPPVYGVFRQGEGGYSTLATLLARVEGEEFVRLISGPDGQGH